MKLEMIKKLLPDKPAPLIIRRGPFRGAKIVMSPRSSIRKVLGLYEHELNAWLNSVLPRVRRVIDVGANDGYFTLGCVAAFRRLGIAGEVIAFEPCETHVKTLSESIASQDCGPVRVQLEPSFVGAEIRQGAVTLDSLWVEERTHTLLKIDVEGAELDVIAGARLWLTTTNLFLIEVHKYEYLSQLQSIFRDAGLSLEQVNQRPLWFLGSEARSVENWWLVSA